MSVLLVGVVGGIKLLCIMFITVVDASQWDNKLAKDNLITIVSQIILEAVRSRSGE